MSTAAEISDSITRVGDQVRQLKLAKQPFDDELAQLKSLKQQLAAMQPAGSSNPAPTSAAPKSSKKGKGRAFELKVPKGTKDHHPIEMRLRQHIFRTITQVFDRHGGVTIDTPVFELKEILSGKYGEDSKLIYDLQDQGGELCSLRYDLTVPFARFLAMNKEYQNIKRYHIAKVYRRDNPAMTKGRMREFYQCDFDIAGQYDPMMPDSEILCIITEVLSALDIGEYTIKLNHRALLDGMFALCGVPDDKIRTISSAVDKLDKLPWSEVRKEMTIEKGLAEDVADRIGEYVKLKGGRELPEKLLQDTQLVANARAKKGLEEMSLLFDYLEAFGVTDRVSFDLSLARGLDYYTGLIYEVVVEGSAPPSMLAATAPAPTPAPVKARTNGTTGEEEVDESQVGVGSIAAGGRYDELVGMFAQGGTKIPCVGISFGVERIFSILRQRLEASSSSARAKDLDVYVIGVGSVTPIDRMRLAKELWSQGIKAEFMYKAKPKLGPQFDALDRDAVPLAVIIGPEELEKGHVRIKVQRGPASGDEQGAGTLMARTDMIEFIRLRLAEL